ncbi:MAG: secondary thiamine-phosphate synthase enzyme YjbQ [Proteobacteria bacterium]|nr:secondary thiamine-phosphate synthase enzyme YjbQ [Pseudomonadota bacterium]MBU1737476.1 secondary thiamine-phosphate synthase enzyme YjbQ [Pseudomonadota bacterium]
MQTGKFNIGTSSQMVFVDITAEISQAISGSGITDGLCCIYNPHTTAGLTINEGADPDVQDDMVGALQKIVPMNYPYRHMEGNSPAHIMASLMGSSVMVIIEKGKPVLGTWQKIFFCEFDGPRTRKIFWKIL